MNRLCAALLRPTKVTILLCLLLMGSEGCAPSELSREPQTVTFVYTFSGPPDPYEAHYRALADAFHDQNPQITVELAPWNQAYYGSHIMDQGDVFFLPDTMIAELGLVEQDLIISLSPFHEHDTHLDLADLYPAALASLEVRGELWALPGGVDPTVLFYNKDLFDLVGQPYPAFGWTWDDFLAAALALRDPDAGVYGYATTEVTRDAALLVFQHGGRLLDDLQNPARATLDEPLNVEALDWYARLTREDGYNVAPTLEQVFRDFSRPESRSTGAILYPSRRGEWRNYGGIQNNQVGMWIGELSQRGWLEASTDGALRWAVAPLPRDAQAATFARVWGYVIAAEAPSPESCWAWISFLSEQAPPEPLLMPARQALAEAFTDVSSDEISAVGNEAMQSLVPLSSITWSQFPEAYAAFEQAVQIAVDGRMPAEEALAEAQRRVESQSMEQQ